MPLYEFRCDNCGSFETWRSMAQASESMHCPSCDTLATRIYSVAGLIFTPSALSRRIEQSAEPKVQQRQSHSHSHNHNHHHGRPWMIGH